jgi:hypothetical protein
MRDVELKPKELSELELEQVGGALTQELARFGVGSGSSEEVFALAPLTVQAMSKVIHIVQIGATAKHNSALFEEASRLLLP